MKREYEPNMRAIMNLVHCPACHQPAKWVALKEFHDGYLVTPNYCCDTDGCEFSLEGPKLWTAASIV